MMEGDEFMQVVLYLRKNFGVVDYCAIQELPVCK